MSSNDPFLSDVYRANSVDIEEIHHKAFDALANAVRSHSDNGPVRGRNLTLFAPRAGYGKTHLLARLQRSVESEAIVAPLLFRPELSFSWKRLSADLIRYFRQTQKIYDGESAPLMIGVARRFFADFLQFGIRNGTVFNRDEEICEELLRDSAFLVFDPDPESGISVAAWFVPRFEGLLDDIAEAYSNRLGLECSVLKQWARFLFDQNFCKPSLLPCESELEAQQHFMALGKLASLETPLLFLIDHLDSLESEHGSGRKLAHIVNSVADFIPQSVTILSVNRDTWNELFLQNVPTALSDRLSAETIELEPLNLPEAEHLVLSRIADQGLEDHEANAFLNLVNLRALTASVQANSFTPRTIIRFARRCWEKFDRSVISDPQLQEKTVPFPAEPVASEKSSTKSLSPSEKLAALAESLRQQGIQRVRHEPDSFLLQPDEAPSLAKTFQEIRARSAEQDELAYEPVRVFEVVKQIGANFDLISQTELRLGQNSNCGSLSWEVEGREILIGFASSAHREFWSELGELAVKRAQNESAQSWVKLAILSPNGQPFQLNGDLWNPNSGMTETPILDVIEIDNEVLSGLYAAEELIALQGQAESVFSQREVYAFLATELDYLWQKLTRRSGSTGEAAAAGG